jgi:hypothetical protein
MMGEQFDMFGQTVGIELFYRLDDASVERAPPFLKQTTVGYLMREGVLEGVFGLGEKTRS